MQIIIPMSGFGERFRKAGYTVPKPLIAIDGKPIIAHVIAMFPGETEFLFICNNEHLAEPSFRMAEILQHYCPTGKIIGIAAHKFGPVHAVQQAMGHIDLTQPAIVNYCDFTCFWDWNHFTHFVREQDCAGAIPAYKGFHPHTLGSTNYAYLQETNGWVTDIQEKQPYTANRMEEYASSGTYYFASGKLMLEAFRAMEAAQLTVNGEFYVSLAYKPLLERGEKIAVYPLQHFMQWGTPEDVAEYRYWSDTFHRLAEIPAPLPARGTVIVPMAGLGERFAREGYALTKPLIPVSGLPMVVQATRDLPRAGQYVFVLRSDMAGLSAITATLKQEFPGCQLAMVEAVTEGQAITAQIGLQAAEKHGEVAGPVTFGACDNGALYDRNTFNALLEDDATDVIVWTVRGYANAVRHPQMYGWVKENAGVIEEIKVKAPLGNPSMDPVVLGTFTFKRPADFHRTVERMLARDARINGEFYLDTCINDAVALGLRCRIFEVESYLSWGTPNDLRTFEYWQSCFHKWEFHPYRLEQDARVPAQALKLLEMRFAATVASAPGSAVPLAKTGAL